MRRPSEDWEFCSLPRKLAGKRKGRLMKAEDLRNEVGDVVLELPPLVGPGAHAALVPQIEVPSDAIASRPGIAPRELLIK